jgi:hypothetical protein
LFLSVARAQEPAGQQWGAQGKPKPEQPEYNGAENETDTEDKEHRPMTKSSAGLNSGLDCAAFFCAWLPPAV